MDPQTSRRRRIYPRSSIVNFFNHIRKRAARGSFFSEIFVSCYIVAKSINTKKKKIKSPKEVNKSKAESHPALCFAHIFTFPLVRQYKVRSVQILFYQNRVHLFRPFAFRPYFLSFPHHLLCGQEMSCIVQ